MEFKSFLINSLQGSIGMLTRTLSDFSDADMFVRPCPNANHAAWQLGHITLSEAGSLAVIAPDSGFEVPVRFKELYKKEAHSNDSADDFAPFNTRAQLIEMYTQVRGVTIASAQAMSPGQFDAPTPEKYQSWAKTVGDLIALHTMHSTMHVGQFQVIRRKLGKPILF